MPRPMIAPQFPVTRLTISNPPCVVDHPYCYVFRLIVQFEKRRNNRSTYRDQNSCPIIRLEPDAPLVRFVAVEPAQGISDGFVIVTLQ